MHQLDPFIIYTVKLTMDFKSSVNKTTEDVLFDEKQVIDCSESQVNNSTIKRIMSMKPLSCKAPKLRRENILSLLYHAGIYINILVVIT